VKSGFFSGIVTGLSWRATDEVLFETISGSSGYFFYPGSIRGSYGQQLCGAENPKVSRLDRRENCSSPTPPRTSCMSTRGPRGPGAAPDYRIASYNIPLDLARAGNVAAGHGDVYVTNRGTQPGVVVFAAGAHGFAYAYLFSDYPDLRAPSGIALGP